MTENKLQLFDGRLNYVLEQREKNPMQTRQMDIYDEQLQRDLRKSIVFEGSNLKSFDQMVLKGAVLDERVDEKVKKRMSEEKLKYFPPPPKSPKKSAAQSPSAVMKSSHLKHASSDNCDQQKSTKHFSNISDDNRSRRGHLNTVISSVDEESEELHAASDDSVSDSDDGGATKAMPKGKILIKKVLNIKASVAKTKVRETEDSDKSFDLSEEDRVKEQEGKHEIEMNLDNHIDRIMFEARQDIRKDIRKLSSSKLNLQELQIAKSDSSQDSPAKSARSQGSLNSLHQLGSSRSLERRVGQISSHDATKERNNDVVSSQFSQCTEEIGEMPSLSLLKQNVSDAS